MKGTRNENTNKYYGHANRYKNVAFNLADIHCMISLLNGIAVKSLGPEDAKNLLGKLNTLRYFAEGGI